VSAWSHGVDTQFFSYHDTPQVCPELGVLARPVSLFVGRLTADKNLEAFLDLDVPGTKVVCGEGPLAETLRARYPAVRWLGHLSRSSLARVYAGADVFVMPAQHCSFSLVMLEALACGLPVAAYPTQGAKEILGAPAQGGAMDHDLRSAWYSALALARYKARSRALNFNWAYAALMFVRHVVAVRSPPTFEIRPYSQRVVTNMSSKS
jgi:glycosyltransferase involved in cell wall biosynthesis